MIAYLSIIALQLALLGAFLALVTFEERRGNRLILAGRRYRFDLKVERAFFIIRHVDWGAFFFDLTRASAERLLHDIAHSTLIGVRFIERQLTSTVRTLRARRDDPLLPMRTAERPSKIQSAVTLLKRSVKRSRKRLMDLPQGRDEG